MVIITDDIMFESALVWVHFCPIPHSFACIPLIITTATTPVRIIVTLQIFIDCELCVLCVWTLGSLLRQTLKYFPIRKMF